MTPEQIEGMADAIEAAMETMPIGTGWTPSAVARKAKVTTDQARLVLSALEVDDEIEGDGNGAWRRYYLKSWRYPWTTANGLPSKTPVN